MLASGSMIEARAALTFVEGRNQLTTPKNKVKKSWQFFTFSCENSRCTHDLLKWMHFWKYAWRKAWRILWSDYLQFQFATGEKHPRNNEIVVSPKILCSQQSPKSQWIILTFDDSLISHISSKNKICSKIISQILRKIREISSDNCFGNEQQNGKTIHCACHIGGQNFIFVHISRNSRANSVFASFHFA